MVEVPTRPPYPVQLEIAYPESSSRWWAVAALLFVKSIALIPHMIVLFFLQMASLFAAWISWIAILFTGRYPRALFDFQVGVIRWSTRTNAWFLSLCDEYPPFQLHD